MPFNDDKALLKAAGLDPEGYIKIGDNFYAGLEKPEPTTPTAPQLTSSAKGAFGRSAAANTIPALIGAGVGVAAGAALSATGVGATVGVPLIGAALAGGAAAMGAGKVQENFLTEDFKKQLAADQEQHPIASAIGGAAPALLTARPTSIGQLTLAGRGVMGSVNPVARSAAKELALNTGVNVGTGMALRGAAGGEAFDGKDVALDALLGVALAGKAHNNAINRGFDRAGEAIHEKVPRLVEGSKEPYVGLTTQPSEEDMVANAILAAQANKKPAFEEPKPIVEPAVDPKVAEAEALKAKIIAGEDLNPPKPQMDKETAAYLKQARAVAKKAGFELTPEEEGIIAANRALKAQAEKEAAAQAEKLSAEAEAAKKKADEESEIQKQIDEAYATRRRQLEFEAAKRQAEDESKIDEALKLRREVEADNAVLDATGEPPKELPDPVAEAQAMQDRLRLEREILAENKAPALPRVDTSKGKIREVPSWMDRTSESKEGAPSVANLEPEDMARLKASQEARYIPANASVNILQELAKLGNVNARDALLRSPKDRKAFLSQFSSEENANKYFALREKYLQELEKPENTNYSREDTVEQQPLTQGMFDLVATHYGPALGIKLAKSHRPVKDEGAGIPKGVIIDNKNAFVTPKATADTPFHEVLGHGFVKKALADEGTPLNKQVKQLIKLAEGDAKYAAWKAEAESRIAAGKLSPSFDTGVKEYVAQVFGVKLADALGRSENNRYVSRDLKYRLELFGQELRRVFRRASADDMFALVQDAMIYGARPSGRAVGVALQHDRSDKDVREAKKRVTGEEVFGEDITKYYHPYNRSTRSGHQSIPQPPARDSSTHKLNPFELTKYEKNERKSFDEKSGITVSQRALMDDLAKSKGFIPLQVFHGSKTLERDLFSEGSSFSTKLLGTTTEAPSAHLGHFFSLSPSEAANYGKVSGYYIKPDKMFVYDMAGQEWTEDSLITKKIEKAFQAGYDVVALKNFRDPGGDYNMPSTHIVVKAGHENIIKSSRPEIIDPRSSNKSFQELKKLEDFYSKEYQEAITVVSNYENVDTPFKVPANVYKHYKNSLADIKAKLFDSQRQLDNLKKGRKTTIPPEDRFNTDTTDFRFSHEGAPEIPETPYKSNIARMVGAMKQDRFTKGQLEAEIRKNKSTMEEYDYRGLAKTLPEKLDKATVLKAVEEVAPKIERVNYSDKNDRRDDFNYYEAVGITKEHLVEKTFDKEMKDEYKKDPASFEQMLDKIVKDIYAVEKSNHILVNSSEDFLRALALSNKPEIVKVAKKALKQSDAYERANVLFNFNEDIGSIEEDFYRIQQTRGTSKSLQHDPVSDTRFARYWTTNPNRSETTLKIPGADYADRERSKEHFSNDTFGWIRTSEGEAGGVPTKIMEESQSDVTKDFRKRTEKEQTYLDKVNSSSHKLANIYKKQVSEEQGLSTQAFRDRIENKSRTIDKETLATTPYLNSERRLLLKQLILEAERDGFRKIAWTTGDEQARRNGRDVIEGGRVEWSIVPAEQGSTLGVSFSIPGHGIKQRTVSWLREALDSSLHQPAETVDENIGLKAKHINEILARIKRGETSGSYEAISGEGYKNIYDREDVKEARRLGLEPKLEVMSDGVTRWTAEITPKASEEARYAFSEAGAPEISSLKDIVKQPGGAYVEEKLRAAQRDNTQLKGRYLNQALLVLQNAPNPERIYAAAVARRHGENGPTLTARQETALARYQALLKALHDEQRARGLKVQDYEGGKLVWRDAEDDPNYIPEVVSSKVYDTLSNNPESPEGRKLVKDFLDFKTAQYGSAKAAQDAYDRMIPRKGGSPRLEYNAARLAEGNGLPPSWRETDFGQVTRKYFSKMAADLAFYKNIQADPAMRQLLAINSDGNSATSPKATKLPDGTDITNIDYSNHPDVIAAMEDMMGRRAQMPINAQAVNRLAKTLMIGIPGKLRDFVATPFIAMEVGGVGTLRYLPKALANLSEGMREVVNRGLADIGRDAWFDNTLSEASMMADKVNKISDTIGAVQGLPQLEQANRGLTWLLGKYVAESKLGDKKFLVEWGPKEPMSPEETVKFIADRTVDAVQGTYDFRGVPTWMRNSSLGSVFALSKWSAERYKNFQQHVIKPAAKGDLKPLLTSALGVFLGSAAIDELNELIKQKKPEHLSWSEWAGLGMPETGYKLATAVSSSGVMGIAGDLVLNVYQKATDKRSQEFGIPAINLAENLVTRVAQMTTAESLDLPKLIHVIAKDNIQTYRDLVSGFDENTDAKRDYRVYDRITNDRSSQAKPSNPFEERASEMTIDEYLKSDAKKPGSAMRVYDNRNPLAFNRFLEGIGEGRNVERRLIKQYEEDEKEKGRRAVLK